MCILYTYTGTYARWKDTLLLNVKSANNLGMVEY